MTLAGSVDIVGLKGHGFSRAVMRHSQGWALASEGARRPRIQSEFPQRLKPSQFLLFGTPEGVPFQDMMSTEPH